MYARKTPIDTLGVCYFYILLVNGGTHIVALTNLILRNPGRKRLQDNSPTNQLAVSQVADWTTRGLVNSPTANF